MMEKEKFDKLLENICLLDNSISLEAKGLYYTAYFNACGNNQSLQELFDSCNEDKEFVFKLIEELIHSGYFVIGLPMDDGSIFIFREEKGK